MGQVLLSLDEIDRVKRINGIYTTVDLAKKTEDRVSRKTWTRALKDRTPTKKVLDELAALGARLPHLLVYESFHDEEKAAA